MSLRLKKKKALLCEKRVKLLNPTEYVGYLPFKNDDTLQKALENLKLSSSSCLSDKLLKLKSDRLASDLD